MIGDNVSTDSGGGHISLCTLVRAHGRPHNRDGAHYSTSPDRTAGISNFNASASLRRAFCFALKARRSYRSSLPNSGNRRRVASAARAAGGVGIGPKGSTGSGQRNDRSSGWLRIYLIYLSSAKGERKRGSGSGAPNR